MEPSQRPVTPTVRPWAVIALTLAVVAVLIGASVLSYLAGRATEAVTNFTLLPAEQFESVGDVNIQSLQELSELTTVEMVLATTVEKGTDRGWLNWATGDSISMLVVAEVGAGVDLSEIDDGDVVVDQELKKVELRLPAATITGVAVDNTATGVYDRRTGIFTNGDPNLERSARLAAEEILVEDALERGILTTAERSAVTALTNFLSALGYEEIDVLVGS